MPSRSSDAVIRRYQFDPSASAAVDRNVREILVPRLNTVPGFVTYYGLNSGAGAGLTQQARTLTPRSKGKPWLHRIEKLVPQIRVKAEQAGGIVVANLGQKCLPEGRVVSFPREANCTAGCRRGA
jgi:hypothetical protein